MVYHFSGPDRYAYTRTLLKRSRSVGGAPLRGIPPISYLTPYGFTRPLTCTHVRLLGSCFKTGRMERPQARVWSAQMPKHAKGARCLPKSDRLITVPHLTGLFAIGLSLVFSLGRNSPPDLGCIPKQPNSWACVVRGPHNRALTLSHPFPGDLGVRPGTLLGLFGRPEPPDSKVIPPDLGSRSERVGRRNQDLGVRAHNGLAVAATTRES
ncbi:hypothetical protein H5410_042030 [Solanum commersonii]|uniref:Uncharacterized protein n=1 Tax=Solanum commersonii TaxID=4109 RepID=A0A9J5XWB9_SOLCO|nr:hypothetical protein H5410_042030 [Solanum commersonii]